jgi:hypothetical protein
MKKPIRPIQRHCEKVDFVYHRSVGQQVRISMR